MLNFAHIRDEDNVFVNVPGKNFNNKDADASC